MASKRPDILTNVRAERVRKVVALSGRSARSRQGLTLVEGPGAVAEAISYIGEFIQDLYWSDSARSYYRTLYDQTQVLCERVDSRSRIFHTSDQVAKALSPAGQGIIAVVDQQAFLPENSYKYVNLADTRLILIAEQIQDPGNLGTLIRLADATGADGVIVCQGSAEVTSPKVIRASAGSCFHLPIWTGVNWEGAINRCQTAGLAVYASTPHPSYGQVLTMSLDDLGGQLQRPHAWVMGNESRGLSNSQLSDCDQVVTIPMYGSAESLNVAGAAAILLYNSARHIFGNPANSWET